MRCRIFINIPMKNGILREKKKNFILQSEFMFPEESNPFSIVSLFLACSKLNERGHKNPDYLKIFPNRYFLFPNLNHNLSYQ